MRPDLVVCEPRALSLRLCRARLALSWATERLNRARQSASVECAVCPWPGLSCAHGLCIPISIVGDKTFCRGQLCCDRISPYSGQLCHDIELLCRYIISPYLGHLCRDIKILCRDIISPYLGQLSCDIKIFCRDRKLLAWPTLSRHKNTPSRKKIFPA